MIMNMAITSVERVSALWIPVTVDRGAEGASDDGDRHVHDRAVERQQDLAGGQCQQDGAAPGAAVWVSFRPPRVAASTLDPGVRAATLLASAAWA